MKNLPPASLDLTLRPRGYPKSFLGRVNFIPTLAFLQANFVKDPDFASLEAAILSGPSKEVRGMGTVTDFGKFKVAKIQQWLQSGDLPSTTEVTELFLNILNNLQNKTIAELNAIHSITAAGAATRPPLKKATEALEQAKRHLAEAYKAIHEELVNITEKLEP